jgi:hypothetical protein
MRVEVLYWMLGTALGILLHVVFFPSSNEHIFRVGARQGQLPADIGRDPSPELLPPSGCRSPESNESGQGQHEPEMPWDASHLLPSG